MSNRATRNRDTHESVVRKKRLHHSRLAASQRLSLKAADGGWLSGQKLLDRWGEARAQGRSRGCPKRPYEAGASRKWCIPRSGARTSRRGADAPEKLC
ncbi:hypothetical protein DPEC_G00303110 [Dallia pectoralis]|uniref:Uncharacterized protein n=1 Tax=Dallia pectoralis TaxID=75939 RepID=A0ACC2FH50_DALPE|nr:hypothetical protein DPEC_G00303110 [Dallia pectoralis]